MSAVGYFVAFVNARAYTLAESDRALMVAVTQAVRSVKPGSQVQWAGSVRKSTAIVGSDLDMCVETQQPITLAERRAIREALQRALNRDVHIQSHVLRLPRHGATPKLDVAFANAAFGCRPLPDISAFRDRPARQQAARALKLWLSAPALPAIAGWAVEALVVHADAPPDQSSGLDLFLKMTDWLARVGPADVIGVLKPHAKPQWEDAWTPRVPGLLTALANHARALKRRAPGPTAWRSAADVGMWLGLASENVGSDMEEPGRR